MGIQLDETDLSELEPQIFKIFKAQLGFFDNNILSSTMEVIHQGIDRKGLESQLSAMVETKKASKLSEEVKKDGRKVHFLKFTFVGLGNSV